MNIEPVILEGEFVRLEPLKWAHHEPLFEVGFDESIWRWSPESFLNPEDMFRYVDSAIRDYERGTALPFVTIDKTREKIVGSTRFGNIDASNRRTEIGWTWINPAWQRTFINTEAKLLMLTHAFETWNCIRVELKTDALNEKSRAAILRIGAKEEGTLRQHMITASGRFRDTVYFSIIDSEWRAVKENLSARLRSYK